MMVESMSLKKIIDFKLLCSFIVIWNILDGEGPEEDSEIDCEGVSEKDEEGDELLIDDGGSLLEGSEDISLLGVALDDAISDDETLEIGLELWVGPSLDVGNESKWEELLGEESWNNELCGSPWVETLELDGLGLGEEDPLLLTKTSLESMGSDSRYTLRDLNLPSMQFTNWISFCISHQDRYSNISHQKKLKKVISPNI